MRAFWSDPYLWIHAAGLAALPLCLLGCLLGLAVGDPLLPVWLELGLIAAVGIAPIIWMQWQKPFYIFSLVAVALKPTQLTDDQRRILTLFKARRSSAWIGLGTLLLLVILRQIYYVAPIAAEVTPFASGTTGIRISDSSDRVSRQQFVSASAAQRDSSLASERPSVCGD